MMWLYPIVPQHYFYAPFYMPVFDERLIPVRQIESHEVEVQPYLQTWPYSNSYYGNYYES